MTRSTVSRILGSLILALAWSSSALAAAGDPCPAAQFRMPPKPGLHPVWCRILVDNAGNGTAASTFDIASSSVWATADMSFEVSTEDCAAGTIAFESAEVVGGVKTDLATPNPTLSLAAGGTTRIDFHGPIGSAITSTWGAGTLVSGCTVGFDVLLVGYDQDRR